jgi:hypothetical protein
MKNADEAGVFELRRWHLGALCLAGTLFFAIACGSDESQSGQQIHPPPPLDAGAGTGVEPVTVSLDQNSFPLGLQQTATVTAQVSGGSSPVNWGLDCDTGRASLVSTGNSATITAVESGECFVSATVGNSEAVAIFRIPPLLIGEICSSDSECDAAAPLCRRTDGPCPRTCTQSCGTDGDCPVIAHGRHLPCNHGLCSYIRDLASEWCP